MSYKKWVNLKTPEGKNPVDGVDLKLQEEPIPEPGAGEYLVKVLVVSVDPYLRMLMGNFNFYFNKSMDFPRTQFAEAAGKVVKSNNDNFPVGTLVKGHFGWSQYALCTGKEAPPVQKVPPKVKLSHTLGILGMPGATAYYGFVKVCDPQPGKVLAVSGAAGAVGTAVLQIGKLKGTKVVGFAGGSEKCEFVKSLGADHCIDYQGKTADQLAEEIKKVVPEGIDYYFENTGGPVTDAVVRQLNRYAKVSVCGVISNYTDPDEKNKTAIPVQTILMKSLTIKGWIVSDFGDWTEGLEFIRQHIVKGDIKVPEDTSEGIENVLEGFLELYGAAKSGHRNFGKKIVKVNDDEEALGIETN